jgi:hypothetical protein
MLIIVRKMFQEILIFFKLTIIRCLNLYFLRIELNTIKLIQKFCGFFESLIIRNSNFYNQSFISTHFIK